MKHSFKNIYWFVIKKVKMGRKKIKGLTLQFIPYREISGLDSVERIKKLLKIILDNKVVVLQGRLRVDEESRLIEDTMVMIDNVKGFKGIELEVISGDNEGRSFFERFKSGIAKMIVGQQDAITIIGPASIVKEMKKDPSKLEIVMS
ncbi:hypothetical protein CMI42_06495 [Candidatus Pacearchaeota archaeon]|jgi:hypothetical protein|nr:hypothetical protein [Candidatus Pacearchaeota archaeon]|tara:strand:- start:373 stop:813 length:441 start_codon:yes stop_codon:yes gene_type:complete